MALLGIVGRCKPMRTCCTASMHTDEPDQVDAAHVDGWSRLSARQDTKELRLELRSESA